jgi:tetratricopeptide (TPR) repeat protein
MPEADETAGGGYAANALLAATLGTVSDNPRIDALLERQIALADLQIDTLRKEDEFETSHLRWRRFNDQMKGALQIMIVALGALVVVAVGAAMWNASQADGLVVDSFSVPPALAATGTTGDIVADDMTNKIAAVRDFASANSLAHANEVSEDRSRDVKVEIPETGVSLAEAWRILKLWLGHERHLTGNVRTLPDGNIALTVSLSGADSVTFTGKPGDLDALEQKAAERIFATVDPINIVLYLAGKNRIDEALAAATHHVAIAQSTRDLAGAYSLQGNMIRNATGDVRRALAVVHLAIALDPKAAPQRMEAISSSRMLGHDEEALAQARVIATLHPEDNIASWRTSNGFAYVQELGARWRAAFSGDFATLAILPSNFAYTRPDTTVLHAQGLARQHDIGAARARLEEAAAEGQPDPGEVARAKYYIDTVRNDWRAVAADAQDYANVAATYNEGMRKLLVQTRVMPLLARPLAAQGNFDAAQKALMATPLDCFDCVLARADVAALAHDWRGADTWYVRAVHLAPSLPFAYTNWGQTLLQKGDLAGAIAKFDLAHRKGPHFADPLELWGEALMLENRSDLALAKFSEAARYAPNWGRLHLKWGEALHYAGRDAEAKKQFALTAALYLAPSERAELSKATHV